MVIWEMVIWEMVIWEMVIWEIIHLGNGNMSKRSFEKKGISQFKRFKSFPWENQSNCRNTQFNLSMEVYGCQGWV